VSDSPSCQHGLTYWHHSIATSDHASWTLQGYPAVMAAEGKLIVPGDPQTEAFSYIHTANDTMTLNNELGKFSVEVGSPIPGHFT
jgi:hypothetical protein